MKAMHNIEIDELKSLLKTDFDTGLPEEQVAEGLREYGENKLISTTRRTIFKMLLDQFKDFTVIILIIAAVISIALGEMVDGAVIIGIVILNAALGTYQENKASNALDALKSMASPKAKVIRGGETKEVDSALIIPGDIVLLEAGDYVPADLRLIESINLKVDESALTGESVPVEKNQEAVLDEKAPIGDRINAAYSGTIVTYGRAKAVVVNTGMKTEIGHIAKMLNEATDELTPLQKKLAEFGKLLGIICLVVSAVIMVLGVIRKENLLEIFMTAVSLAVAAIPEGLPAVVTTVLALGMQRMVKRNAIMKRLSAVETLGSTTTICSDKTGTLTQNKMTVMTVYANNKEYTVSGTGYATEGEIAGYEMSLERLMLTASLCNDALIQEGNCIGDPTEGALVVLAEKAGIHHRKIREQIPRLDEFPFDSDRKLMSTVHEINGQRTMLTKGAPDELLARCSGVLIDGEEKQLTDDIKEALLNQNAVYARQALRVIGYAYRPVKEGISLSEAEENLIFLGLTGMIDPPREEAIEAIRTCKQAGIEVVMITGDHVTTASAIGEKLGILDESHRAIEGAEINDISDEDLVSFTEGIHVYARVSPEHKVRIVKAIQGRGQVVAMTGDGVNDAPALKNADIGVAMGITGTDVSKEAADMILTDDNFASIVSAVEEGRIIYSNIRKFVGFLLSCNVGEILIIFISMLVNWGVPLVPIQLLWVNLITDSFPAFALGVEKGEKGIMNQSPRDKNEPIVNRKMAVAIALQSFGLAVAVLASYRIGADIAVKTGASDPVILSRTFAFMTLIFGEMFRAYSARREDQFLWQFNPFGNRYLNLSVVIAIVLLMAVVYIPGLQGVFKTTTISLTHFEIIIGLSLIPTLLGELSKFVTRKL